MAASAYPPPPPYYRLYKDFAEHPDFAPAPPPPIAGTYNLFGSNYTTDDVLPSLEEQGLRQLYPTGPNVDYKKELRALNRELSFQFLELSDVLVERPSQYARRVEDMGLILRNMHHLLNSLRPHQARATLIHILESQIQRRKKAVADIRRKREEVRQLLQESLSTLDCHMNDVHQDGRGLDAGMAAALMDHLGPVTHLSNALEQLVAIGMLPVASPGPRVGQRVTFQWRIERLKEGSMKVISVEGDSSEDSKKAWYSDAQDMEELEYELQASTENWMIAGRKKGHILVSSKMGARVIISLACVPLVADHV